MKMVHPPPHTAILSISHQFIQISFAHAPLSSKAICTNLWRWRRTSVFFWNTPCVNKRKSKYSKVFKYNWHYIIWWKALRFHKFLSHWFTVEPLCYTTTQSSRQIIEFQNRSYINFLYSVLIQKKCWHQYWSQCNLLCYITRFFIFAVLMILGRFDFQWGKEKDPPNMCGFDN